MEELNIRNQGNVSVIWATGEDQRAINYFLSRLASELVLSDYEISYATGPVTELRVASKDEASLRALARDTYARVRREMNKLSQFSLYQDVAA